VADRAIGDRGHRVRALEGPQSRRQLVQDDAEAVDVAGDGRRSAAQLFRTRIQQRERRRSGRLPSRIDEPGRAEVEQLDAAFCVTRMFDGFRSRWTISC
jgi:hypothetical protein